MDRLVQLGFEREFLIKETGLFSQDGKDYFDGRAIFPIHNFLGEIVGFGGRVIKGGTTFAKYLNTKANAAYDKSRELYGLYFAKQEITKKDIVYLTEGYLDVIAMHQKGFTNTVATCGTALTENQVYALKRLTNNITIIFDGDNAGIKAANRALNMCIEAGMNVRIINLPEGLDPDSLCQLKDFDEIETILNQAYDFVEYKIHVAEHDLKEVGKMVEVIDDLMETISRIKDTVVQDFYLNEACDRLSLSKVSALHKLKYCKDKNAKISKLKKEEIGYKAVEPLLIAEDKLIDLIIKHGDVSIKIYDQNSNELKVSLFSVIVNYFNEDDYVFQNEVNKNIIELCSQSEVNGANYLDFIFSQETERAFRLIIPMYFNGDNLISLNDNDISSEATKLMNLHKREYALKLLRENKTNMPQKDLFILINLIQSINKDIISS